jgi:hypothetical protein
MVDWARQRFALTRYRDGWGVACGLDVSCTSPGGDHACCPDGRTGGPTVYVNSGYAVDCCGNDLVVCDPIAVDLTRVCEPLEDPCGRVPEWPPLKGGQPKPVEPQRDDKKRDCWDMSGGEVIAVNLFLRHHEDLAQGQRTMLRGGCSDVGSCEYTRVLERPCVQAELGALEVQCGDDYSGWEDWKKDLDQRRNTTFQEILEGLQKGFDGLLRYLRRHPPYRFCFLEDYVCCLQKRSVDPKDVGTVAERKRILFWLYFDWLLRELECPCGSCRPDRGVPLARVLLRRSEERGQTRSRVMLIDTAAPHRRPLRKDPCRPVPRGDTDLAPYLWQPGVAAIDALALQGIKARSEVLDEVALLDQLGKTVLSLRRGDTRLLALLVSDPFKCDRVAGFVPDL